MQHTWLALAAVAVLGASGCSDSPTAPALPPGVAPTDPDPVRQPARIEVSAAATSLVEGDSARVSAVAFDADGTAIPGAHPELTISDTTVAVVDARGVLRARGAGQALLRAALDPAAPDTLRVTVRARSGSPADSAAAPPADSAAAPASESGPAAIRIDLSLSRADLLEGDTARVSVVVFDQDGDLLPDAAPELTVSDTTVAVVDARGVLRARGAGQALLVAALGPAASDTLPVTVRARAVAAPSVCAPALSLGVGEVRHFTAAEAASLCLAGAEAGAEYVVVPLHTGSVGSLSLEVSATGLATPPDVSAARVPTRRLRPGQPPRGDGGFELRLRRRERDALAHRLPTTRGPSLLRRSLAPSAPVVGALETYNVQSSPMCGEPDLRTGRVEAVGAHSIVVSDTANPDAGLTPAHYAFVAATFDSLVWEVNTRAFGEPYDIDGNRRVVIFYTRAVNELTPASASYMVGGFFLSRDLFPRTDAGAVAGCAGSNEAEMFYVMAVDPEGEVNGNPRSLESVMQQTVATIGHEFQHLIQASRRLQLASATGSASWSEEIWLDEGLSHIAEELLFYRASGLTPGSNVGMSHLQNFQHLLEATNRYSYQNLARLGVYLEDPASATPFGADDDLATRGATWAFLRYAADRLGGDQNRIWYDLVNTTSRGMENLAARFGPEVAAWAHDWQVSLYTDDFVSGVEARYRQPSWNFRSIMPGVTRTYPLPLQPLAGERLRISLASGGAAYLPAAVAASAPAEVRLTSGGAPLPPTLHVRVIRTR